MTRAGSYLDGELGLADDHPRLHLLDALLKHNKRLIHAHAAHQDTDGHDGTYTGRRRRRTNSQELARETPGQGPSPSAETAEQMTHQQSRMLTADTRQKAQRTSSSNAGPAWRAQRKRRSQERKNPSCAALPSSPGSTGWGQRARHSQPAAYWHCMAACCENGPEREAIHSTTQHHVRPKERHTSTPAGSVSNVPIKRLPQKKLKRSRPEAAAVRPSIMAGRRPGQSLGVPAARAATPHEHVRQCQRNKGAASHTAAPLQAHCA